MSPFQKVRAVSEAQTILGVEMDATDREIHAAWKKLAFKLHPDRGAPDSSALAQVNAAYTLLKNRAKSLATRHDETKTANAPTAPRPVRPRTVRPSMPVRIAQIDHATRAACAARVAKEPQGHGHVAIRLERTGRKLVYIVETALAEGVNRVAMPVVDFGDGRKAGPNAIAFRSSKAGPGTLELPDSVRENMFPGATSVLFRFAL